jgi:maleylacetate reductase
MLSGVYRFPPMESVIYGRPFAEAVKEQVEQSGATAVFLLASGTLARETGLVGQIRGALGNRLAGMHARIGAHTPRTDVVDAANAARRAGADLLLTLGGGSVTDAAKMVAFCLGNRVTDPAQLDDYRARVSADGNIVRPDAKPPSVRTVTIPTTLSAGEYTASAGCTDTARNVKESFGHPLMMPKTVILDPRVTVHTPEWLFLSTGIRAVDHAVEDICSPQCQPISEGASYHALKLLGRGLLGVKADPLDLEARLDCQLGAWMSMVGSQTGWLYFLRDAAARLALQPCGQCRASGPGQRRARPPGRSRRGSRRRLDRRARAAAAAARRRRETGSARPHRRIVDARPLDPHQSAQDRRPARRPRTARRGVVAIASSHQYA